MRESCLIYLTRYYLRFFCFVDIDECQTYGICDQHCKNSLGSYTCICQKDYLLQDDNKTCKAHGKLICQYLIAYSFILDFIKTRIFLWNSAGEATLVFSTKTKIVGMYLDSIMFFDLVSNLIRAVAVAMNGDYVYWSDIENDSEIIVRSIRNKHEVIVTTGKVLIDLYMQLQLLQNVQQKCSTEITF